MNMYANVFQIFEVQKQTVQIFTNNIIIPYPNKRNFKQNFIWTGKSA